MVKGTDTSLPPAQPGPAWQIARLFPDRGHWTAGDYLTLNRLTNRLVELASGDVEVLDMPTRSHQRAVLNLRDALQAALGTPRLGEVLVAPYPLQIDDGRYREPDVLFVRAENLHRMHEDFTEVADLVIEVLSQDRRRDLVVKRQEYADAGVPEYWIADLDQRQVTILALRDGAYVEVGTWGAGEVAQSPSVPGFRMDPEKL